MVTTFLDPHAPLHSMARAYLDALLAGRRREAERIVREAIEAGASVEDIYLHVFEPTQREIGLLWEHNQVSVADEHYCTAATQLIMSQLWPMIMAAPRLGRTAMCVAVRDDLHELGLRIVADFLEMAGWDVFYVGGNTPISTIVEAVERRAPDLLAVGASMARHVESLAVLVQRVRAAIAEAPPIMVGGAPFDANASLWRQVKADADARNGPDSVAVAGRLVRNEAV